jgi:N-acyl-D-amino-acid deacylase
MAACDLLIRGGTVIDGSGAPGVSGDVALTGDRITAVGTLEGIDAKETVDAAGLVVAPGFIDVHTHDDQAVFAGPDMTPKISQGVTSVVVGNCGVSLSPLILDGDPPPPMNLLGDRACFRFPKLRDYRDALAAAPAAVNVAMLVGHSTLRAGVMDDLGRAASEREIGRMGELLDEALESGAVGLSTGLAYPTAIAAPTSEVTALARHLAPHDAVYTTHMRDEGEGVIDSIEETLEIGRQAGVRTVISHHKCNGSKNWGRSVETLALIEKARAEMALDLDCYPYTASSTVLLPDFVEGAERVLITWSESHPERTGQDLSAIAAEWGCSRLEAAERLLPAGAIYFSMHEDDLRRIMAFRDTMIGSDGLPHDTRPHPRLWGTFPRVLGHYSRELGLLPLEEAVRRMTSVGASVFGLEGRGRLAAGAHADVVLFDAARVIDKADFEDPMRPAAGIELVIVNGAPVWRGGGWTGARPGRIIGRGNGGTP